MIYKVSFQNHLFTILQMTLIFSFLPKNLVQLTMNESSSSNWLRNNKLSLNETKTELIIIKSPRSHLPHEPDIRVNSYKLKLHSHIMYLGILIDEVLSWSKQIDDICTKLARANGILSKLRRSVSKKTCVSVYFSLFYSHVLYGYLVWSYSTQPNIDRIIKLQKRYIR